MPSSKSPPRQHHRHCSSLSSSDENNNNHEHDWEFSKENAAPLEHGRSTKTLSKRAFGTSTAEVAMMEEKTKKYERLVRRSEKAVEWLQKESKKLLLATNDNDDNNNHHHNGSDQHQRELTEKESQTLRSRLATELGFDPTTTTSNDRDNNNNNNNNNNIDHDPLRYWILYIKHIRESYPSDSQKQFLLMERCARTFMTRPFLVPSYQNDVRFIRTCILYADKTSSPSDVFKLMSKTKVGTKVSLFWVAWAWVAEKAQDYPFTEKIFQKALSVGAEPRKFLEERQKQFLRRMSRHWLNASRVDGEDAFGGNGGGDGNNEEEEEDEGDGRGALNSLSRAGMATNNRSSAYNATTAAATGPDRPGSRSRTNTNSQQQQQQHNQLSNNPHQDNNGRNSSRSRSGGRTESKTIAGFNIFQDDDENSPHNDVLDESEEGATGQRLARESDRTKENNMRAERWNERGYGLVNPTLTSSASGGAVPGAAESIVGTVRHSSPGRSSSSSSRVGGRVTAAAAAFDVFVDEDCNADETTIEESNHKLREDKMIDNRSLRQRLDGGTADRLTRDPLRYMKNPSKVKSDELKYDSIPEENEKKVEKTKRSEDRPPKHDNLDGKRGGQDQINITHAKDGKNRNGAYSKELLKTDGSGQECCFEEQRAVARYYKLVTSAENFNLLHQDDNDENNEESQMDFEESIEEVDMDEDDNAPSVGKHCSILKRPSSLRSKMDGQGKLAEEDTTVNPRRVLFGANTNVKYSKNESLNTSTASSQLDGSFVVEETINTKFANAEISMMFCSPNNNDVSVADTPGKPLIGSAIKQTLFSTHRKNNASNKKVGSDENNASGLAPRYITSPYEEDDECSKDDGGNGDTATISLASALATGKQFNNENSHPPRNASLSKDSKGKSFGTVGFSIFQDDGNENSEKEPTCSGEDTASLSVIGGIMSGLDDNVDEQNTLGNKREYGMNFAIFQDESNENANSGTKASKGRASKEIKTSRYSGEDTASLSIIGNVMSELDNNKASGSMDFAIFQDDEDQKTGFSAKTETKPPRYSGEDTASLSIIGDVMGSLRSCSVKDSQSSSGFTIFAEDDQPFISRKESRGLGFGIYEDTDKSSSSFVASPKKSSGRGFKIFEDDQTDSNDVAVKSSGLGFEIFSEEVISSAQKKQKVLGDEPCFGDISMIDAAVDGEKTSSGFQILDENFPSSVPKTKSRVGQTKPVDYKACHNESMESAMQMCMRAAAKSSTKFQIFDHRQESLPKALLRKSFSSGVSIDLLGGETATIIHELGRGVHGVVLLCNVSRRGEEDEGQSDALKIQAPIGSLAHEYSILSKAGERIQPDLHGFYPFPRPQALYAFSEGGLFLMTAGSDSGMTLVDVANTFRGNVPELIALYYTSRMLRHLEALHQVGKILHCDVKPDNWVLTSSANGNNNSGTKAIGGSDLMLVDFGRAVDLDKVASRGSNSLSTLFHGNVAAEDMECGTMRQGLPWGVDLDYFGLCASSHILLFGSHMEVAQDKSTGRFHLQKTFRRYWKRDLWQMYFDALLNFDVASENDVLRDIRIAFDEYIGKERKQEITSHLTQLHRNLPKKR